MININGLLAKMLIMVMLVAVIALGASYTFVNIQQKQTFKSNIDDIKTSHQQSASVLFQRHLEEQVLSAEEIVMLSGITNMPSAKLKNYFSEIWPRIQLSFMLSSMSFSNGEQRYDYGRFPDTEMQFMHDEATATLTPQSGIICHIICELTSTIPVSIQDERWSFSLLSNIGPSIIFLSYVVGSDIGIVSNSQAISSQNMTLSRYVIEFMTGTEKNVLLMETELSEKQLEKLENDGLQITTADRDYYVWFEKIKGIGTES
jgi:hypothetical protein